MLNSRRTKIIIDIFMAVLLILSFIKWHGSGGAIYHIVVGTLCAFFFALHIFIHSKWIKATTKSCFTGKLSKTLRAKYIVDILLLVIWSISIITGFIAIFPFFSEADDGFGWGQLHGITARIGLILVIVHAVQHIPQIKSYLNIK